MNLNITICDDERNAITVLKKHISQYNIQTDHNIIVSAYLSAEDFLLEYKKHPCDVALLDIEMPGIDGLSVARKLRELDQETALVFLTSHLEYALKGYEVNALRYLTKPVKKEQLTEIINHLIEKNSEARKILLKAEDEMVMVSVRDILYMEACNQDIRIVTRDREYLRRYNIRDYEEQLNPYFFVRCHRSYLVNLSHIARIAGRDIVVDNQDIIPLSRTKEKSVKEALITYTKRSAL